MKIIKGISASAGIVFGKCCMYEESQAESYQSYSIKENQIENEVARLKEAKSKAVLSMRDMINSAENFFDAKSSEIYKSHLLILEDKTLYDKIEAMVRGKMVNAEHAVNDVFEEYIKKLESKTGHFADLKHDILDIKTRFLGAFENLAGKFKCSIGLKEAVVVAAKRLTPSLILKIPKENVLAFVTEEGGFTTHATILARNLNVPVIFGVDVEKQLRCGDSIIVDGSLGRVVVDPDNETKLKYQKKIEEIQKRYKVCEAKKSEEPVTAGGRRITLKVNISSMEELEFVRYYNYDGIGLLRSEFLFAGKTSMPSEDEQLNIYKLISEKNEGSAANVRLLDIASDKLPPYLTLPAQENPDLGIRGARALEQFKDVYLTQIKAILRASSYGDIRILLPMISDMADFDEFLLFIDNAKDSLKRQNKNFNEHIKVGVMIETPSSALLSEQILRFADFANIGSNDLLQYTLASSRGNSRVEKRYHILHPALSMLMKMVVEAGKKHKKEVCLCGEIASFEEYYPLLLGLGLTSFSVSPAKYDDVKCQVHHYRKDEKEFIQSYFKARNREEVEKLIS